MESDHISMKIPPKLRADAKAAGINMSATARRAIRDALKRLKEKENVRAPVTTPNPDTDQSHDLCEVKGQ